MDTHLENKPINTDSETRNRVQQILDDAREHMECDSALLYLPDETYKNRQITWGVGASERELKDVRKKYSAFELIKKKQKAIYIPDLANSPLELPWTTGSPHIASAVISPVSVGDKIVGLLAFESSRQNAFDENDRKYVERLASRISEHLSGAVMKPIEFEFISPNILRVIIALPSSVTIRSFSLLQIRLHIP